MTTPSTTSALSNTQSVRISDRILSWFEYIVTEHDDAELENYTFDMMLESETTKLLSLTNYQKLCSVFGRPSPNGESDKARNDYLLTERLPLDQELKLLGSELVTHAA
jgi:hypothetical protein